MSDLFAEIALRFLKPLLALILGAVLYVIVTGLLGQPGDVQLALSCWLAAAGFLLLVQEGPL